jgi:hypothetical protein
LETLKASTDGPVVTTAKASHHLLELSAGFLLLRLFAAGGLVVVSRWLLECRVDGGCARLRRPFSFFSVVKSSSSIDFCNPRSSAKRSDTKTLRGFPPLARSIASSKSWVILMPTANLRGGFLFLIVACKHQAKVFVLFFVKANSICAAQV